MLIFLVEFCTEFPIEGKRILVYTDKYWRSQEKLNTQLICSKGEDIWLFTQNSRGKRSLQPDNPLLPVEPGSARMPRILCLFIPDHFPLKS